MSTADPQSSPLNPPPPPAPTRAQRRWYRPGPGAGLGLLLVLLGVYFLLQNLGLLTWVNWDILWPVVLILFGLWIIIRRRRR